MHTKLVFFYFIFAAQIGFTADTVAQEIKFHKNTVSISQSAWDHIVAGTPTESGFSGGHDWPHYEATHLADTDAAYFDTLTNAFIVSSKKGDSLPVIIEKFKTNDIAHFHALFPAEILSKEFIFNAFIAAHGNNGIDHKKKLFFADYEGFKVAGHFQPGKKGEYQITTAYPDLSWHYRILLKHQRDEHFLLSRFMKREMKKRKPVWVRHGINRTNLAQEDENTTRYWPSPIKTLSTQLGEMQAEVTPDEFAIEDRVRDYVMTAWLKDHHDPIDVINLFFADVSQPTEEEFKGMMKVLKLTLNTSLLDRKSYSQPLPKRISILRVRLARLIKSGLHFFQRTSEKEGRIEVEQIPLGPNYANLAEELIQQMLSITLYPRFVEPATLSRDILDVIDVSTNFTKNLTKKLLPDQLLQAELEHHNYAIGIYFIPSVTGQKGDYALTLVPLRSVTKKNVLNNAITYTMVVAITGVTLLSFDFKDVADIPNNVALPITK